MFENVLVGVDEHDGGRDAIALATKLAATYARLTLANVYPTSPSRGAAATPDAHDRGRELLSARRDEAGIEAKLCCFGAPSVGRGLHELAEFKAADLLVVGSSRRSLLGRVLIGDDTRAALNGAPCAVAIAPAGYIERTASIGEIGIGYDASPESAYAVTVARALAAQHGATLSACEAVSIPAYALSAGSVPLSDWIEGMLDDARARIAALGDVVPHAVYGQAAQELAVYGDSVDPLVVGSRGYGPVGRLVHGSTSVELAHSAHCPLLVLTRSGGSGAEETASDPDAEAVAT